MSSYSLLSVLGIEIEYMLVDKDTLDIQPKNDLILQQLAGKQVNEVALGDITASNELVMHVIELKNNGPRPPSEPIAKQFQQTILNLQPLLEEHHLRLLPTGAHPWMNPLTETKRWPYGNKAIYELYDTIFNCQGHGWANLQSMHVNLPFANDKEFCQLHNTIRLLLPLLPALAASTPILDGAKTGLLDSRLDFYGRNQQRIPSICGNIIPDFIESKFHYQQEILDPMYGDIRPFDKEGVLQHEWLNSRAAIAKFEYNAIEIRLLDTQECVNADIAIARVIHAILKHWHTSGSTWYLDKICPTQKLRAIYDKAIKQGLDVCIEDDDMLEHWCLPKKPMTLRDVWSFLIEQVSSDLDKDSQYALEYILRQGNLSERILRACGADFSKNKQHAIYSRLSDCLLNNQPFK